MKVKVKYTIEAIREYDLIDYGAVDAENLLKLVNIELEEDPNILLDTLFNLKEDKIKAELYV